MSRRTRNTQQPQPDASTSTEPVIVSLGMAHVWTEPEPQPAAIDAEHAARIESELSALESRVANLVTALGAAPSANLIAALRDSESRVATLRQQLATLRTQPKPRERFVQAFCVTTQGNKVLRLTPIDAPAERMHARERLAIVQRQLLGHNLDLSKLADDLAARNHTAPLEIGPLIAVGVAQTAGDYRAYRLVIESGRVVEQLPLSPPTSKAAAWRKFRVGLVAVTLADLDGAGIYLAGTAKRHGGLAHLAA